MKHPPAQTKRDVLALCKWIRTVISSSPIEDLRIICDDEHSGANVSYDSIVDHLAKKHSSSLRMLDFPRAYIGLHAIKSLFTTCLHLQEFCVSTGRSALVKPIPHLASVYSRERLNTYMPIGYLSRVFPGYGKAPHSNVRDPERETEGANSRCRISCQDNT